MPSYRVPVFRRLHEELGVVVCHSPEMEDKVKLSGDDQMDFPSERIPGNYLFGRKSLINQRVFTVLRKHRPKVVIAQFSLGVLTFWKLLLLRPFFGYKLIPWSHGIRNRDMVLTATSGHFAIVPVIYRLADVALFYSQARRDRIVRNTPALASKCFVASNTLDTKALQAARAEASEETERPFTMLYLGRLLSTKRLDLILEVHSILSNRHRVRLVFIGDGPEREGIANRNNPDIILTGAIHDTNISALYLKNADVMIMPGYVGLGIVHGFAFGLPMITCRSTEQGPFHSPEIEYLKDGENGFLCDSDPADIAAHIERLILDPDLLARMKENALRTVREEASIDRLVDGFRQAIEYVLDREEVKGLRSKEGEN
ncbi:MAG: glycosyltransferase family 4 protein [Bacteroidetes bacterium]|nr:glycosyltransferase family 4 protein [Bacteroidota bacterium]